MMLIVMSIFVLVGVGSLTNSMSASGMINLSTPPSAPAAQCNATDYLNCYYGLQYNVPTGCNQNNESCRIGGTQGVSAIFNQNSPFTYLFQGNLLGFLGGLTATPPVQGDIYQVTNLGTANIFPGQCVFQYVGNATSLATYIVTSCSATDTHGNVLPPKLAPLLMPNPFADNRTAVPLTGLTVTNSSLFTPGAEYESSLCLALASSQNPDGSYSDIIDGCQYYTFGPSQSSTKDGFATVTSFAFPPGNILNVSSTAGFSVGSSVSLCYGTKYQATFTVTAVGSGSITISGVPSPFPTFQANPCYVVVTPFPGSIVTSYYYFTANVNSSQFSANTATFGGSQTVSYCNSHFGLNPVTDCPPATIPVTLQPESWDVYSCGEQFYFPNGAAAHQDLFNSGGFSNPSNHVYWAASSGPGSVPLPSKTPQCLSVENSIANYNANENSTFGLGIVFLFLAGVILFLLGLGINVKVDGTIFGTGGGVGAGSNQQGTRMAQAIGIFLTVWTPLYSEFGQWTTSSLMGNIGLSLLMLFVTLGIGFIGVFWQILSWS
jgi:hypothetical protein